MKNRAARVVVLGGDPDVARELVYILNREGLQAEAATSLTEAMNLVAKRPYDVMVLDLNMFRGNETVVLDQIRAKARHLRVVALGDLPERDAVVTAIGKQVAAYLVKPVGKEVLVDVVRGITGGAQEPRAVRNDMLLTIGSRIRAERKRRELTLKQMAERTQLSLSLLSQIERAESSSSVSSLYKISTALGVTLQSLFEGF